MLVEGFRSAGLVSTIASHFLSTALEMEMIGHFESDLLPPVAVVHPGAVTHPFRIYQSARHRLYLMASEFRLPRSLLFPAARAISDWAKVHDVAAVVTIEGVRSQRSADDRVYALTNDPALAERARGAGISVIGHGMVGGISGTLLLECTKRRIGAASLLIRASEDLSDARAAAEVIAALGRMHGWDVDVRPLLEGARRIEERLDEAIHEVSQSAPEEPSMFR